ncbi:MAG: outer membrane beta-barrel protein [Bacteroidota bacterium]
MKKAILITAIALAGLTFQSPAQNLTIGVKGSFISTWLFNKYVSEAPAAEQYYVPSFGNSYGLSAAIFFNESFGIEANFFYSTHSQKYAGEGSLTEPEYSSETYYNKIEIPLLIKIKSEQGAYFEIGPIYSVISNPTYEYDTDQDILFYIKHGSPEKDIEDAFAKDAIEGMIGLGVDIDLFHHFTLTTALRFSASITDLKGVDATGINLSDYDPPASTHSAAAGFLLGITYRIGGGSKKSKK